jgi:hypothetical protein
MDWIWRESTTRLLSLTDDLFDGHRADDGPQVPGEDPPRQDRHAVLVVEEATSGVGDALMVVAHLEGDDGLAQKGDPLLGDALLGDLRFLHGERKRARPRPDRQHEGTVPRHDLEGQTVLGIALAADE